MTDDPLQTDLITTAAAAQLLGMDRSTLTRRVKAGWLLPVWRAPGYRGDLYFARAQVLAKLAETGSSGTAPKGN